MEYEYLVGHRVKFTFFYKTKEEPREYIGSVLKIIIDNNRSREIIYYLEDGGSEEWIVPHHADIIDFHVEILLDNEIKKYTKFTRFEIMEI